MAYIPNHVAKMWIYDMISGLIYANQAKNGNKRNWPVNSMTARACADCTTLEGCAAMQFKRYTSATVDEMSALS